MRSRSLSTRDWGRIRSTAMIWLTAAAVAVTLTLLATLLGGLCWLAVSWFATDSGALGSLSLGARLQVFLFAKPGDGVGSVVGVFPALVGTSLLVLLMTVIVAPLGVLTAVYLNEYAGSGRYTRLLRIAVHNLAGVPSVIYGVFGLGFFIYGLGGVVDGWFFADSLPKPTFGTPGLLWAALTLALLTLPIVIVTAEEGLSRIPMDIREASIGLGATRIETLLRVTLPAAAPSILTGIILAIARAAGEVAPLMLVGVVKYAPNLPVDTRAPFIHLEQKFMHLGFQVYDTALYGHTGDGRLGLVGVTALLLVLLVIFLNGTAVMLRLRLRNRYQTMVEW